MKVKPAIKASDPFYYKHRNFFVGLFVLIPLLIIPALLVFALVKSEILEKRMKLYIRCETAAGLKETTPVNILGKKVGNIHSFTLNENGYVDVIIQIKTRYSHLVHRDSKARLRQKNFVVGDWEVDLTMGKDPARIKDGDTLEVEYQIRLERMAELFTEMMKPIESIFESLEKGEGIIKYIFGKDTLMTDIRLLLDRVNQIFARVDRTLVSADRMIGNLSQLGDKGIEAVDSLMLLSHSVDGLINDLNFVVSDLDSLVSGFDDLPGSVDNVVELLEKDLKEAELLLKGIQNHWFFRRAMRKQRELEAQDKEAE